MSFVVNPIGGLLGALGGSVLGLGGKRQRRDPALPATRDDAAREAAREQELARRKGASADRIVSGGGGQIGGLGRIIPGS